ncbi:MAG: type II secretion system minor pseudopilin GspK [Gammaproteobacteria bacterium]|nr:type II secretion system minor pseudopilin GspK [Gammaproteobacteria bacterium]MBU1414875.1 type II secretion system minor pseudopilin GspK [Gammaproteobacteria bacterium]
MLTLALMVEIASLVVADYGSAMELMIGRQDQGQSRWLARAAVDWGRNVLAEDKRTSQTDHLGEIWATKVAPTAVEDGEVAGEIVDYSGLFNLNGLVANGIVVPDQVESYKRLLRIIGISSGEADGLAAALVDWLDDDEKREANGAESTWYAEHGKRYRAANGPLMDIDELGLVRGYNEDVIDRLRSLVAALPESVPLNVNTASPEVLSAVVAGLSIDDARAIAARCLVSPNANVGSFLDQLPKMATMPPASRFSVSSRYFLVGGRAKYGQAVTRMQVLLDRKSIWPEIVWQKIL